MVVARDGRGREAVEGADQEVDQVRCGDAG